MTRFKVLLVSAGLFGVASGADARAVIYSGKVETITVTYGTPAIVRFDKPVKTVSNAAQFVIRPASEDSPDYTTLMIEARTPRATSYATFILSSGVMVRTKLVATARTSVENADNVYEIKTGESDSGGSGATSDASAFEVKAMDLMKAMIRGDRVMGYQVRETKKTLLTGALGVEADLETLYLGDSFNGYIVRLANKSKDKTYRIDIRSLRIGEPSLAVLSQIDHELLAPAGKDGSEAVLRIVARPGSVYRDVVLPIAPVKKEKGGGA